MNLATMQFQSKALHRHVTYAAILPEGPGPFPVLLQLHGYSDDYSGWLNFSNIIRHARSTNLIVILPDGATSFYLNHGPSVDYEDFLMEDLAEHVTSTFHVKAGPWAIGGLSMGGFGSLRLACKYPERFASVWAHSGVYPTREELADFPVTDKEDADVYAITERLATAAVRPEITFDCGTEDHLIAHNRRLHQHMERIGLPHRYFEHPGGHTWEFWDEHVKEALEQHVRVLGA